MIALLEHLYLTGRDALHKLQTAYQTSPVQNPLPHRLSILLSEFMYYTSESINHLDDAKKLKTDLEILFHNGVMLNEMDTMLNRTENIISLKTEMGTLQEGLSHLARYVAEIYGYEQAKYIVTSHFQQLSGLWGRITN